MLILSKQYFYQSLKIRREKKKKYQQQERTIVKYCQIKTFKIETTGISIRDWESALTERFLVDDFIA